MPTQSERKALLFLGVVACLGGGVRAMRAASAPSAPTSARRALDAQIQATAGRAAPHGRAASAGRSAHDTNPPERRKVKPVDVKPRITVVRRQTPAQPKPDPLHRVDVDRATVAELQTLPGIGPALAARIVANRDSAGPFGSLDRLQRVSGVGPVTLKRLDSLVTFSGVARP